MADQVFNRDTNCFWMDLHKCATQEAREVVRIRIEECYRYGITTLDLVYGTPDEYEGSIQEAIDGLIEGNELIVKPVRGHATVSLVIKSNADPAPQDAEMHFEAFSGSYEPWHHELPHHRDYYPLRTLHSSDAVAAACNCQVAYVLNVVKPLDSEFAFRVTERGEYTRRDVTRWQITEAGRAKVLASWQKDRAALVTELQNLGATGDEIEVIFQSVRKPLDEARRYKSRAKSLLTQHRKKTS